MPKIKRSLETEHESMLRKEQDKARNARKRALETEHESMLRKEQNRASNAKKRTTTVTVDEAINTFVTRAKFGPDTLYVCAVTV